MDYFKTAGNGDRLITDRSKKTQSKAEVQLAKLLRTPPKTKLPDDLDSLLKLE